MDSASPSSSFSVLDMEKASVYSHRLASDVLHHLELSAKNIAKGQQVKQVQSGLEITQAVSSREGRLAFLRTCMGFMMEYFQHPQLAGLSTEAKNDVFEQFLRTRLEDFTLFARAERFYIQKMTEENKMPKGALKVTFDHLVPFLSTSVKPLVERVIDEAMLCVEFLNPTPDLDPSLNFSESTPPNDSLSVEGPSAPTVPSLDMSKLPLRRLAQKEHDLPSSFTSTPRSRW